MNYIASHLPKGEKIYAKTRKSVLIFARDLAIAIILVAIALCVQFLAKVDIKIMMWVYIAIAVIVLLCVLGTWVKFASTLLVVTTHKFMFKEDIITIRVFDTQLQNIDSIEVEYKTPLRRALNVGNIIIRTRSSEYEFKNISRPDKFTAILNKRASDIQEGKRGTMRISFGVAMPKKPYVVEGKKKSGSAKQSV